MFGFNKFLNLVTCHFTKFMVILINSHLKLKGAPQGLPLILLPPVIRKSTAVIVFFFWPGNVYLNRTAIHCGAIQLLDSFLCCSIIGHFHKGKATATVRYFVHNYFC